MWMEMAAIWQQYSAKRFRDVFFIKANEYMPTWKTASIVPYLT